MHWRSLTQSHAARWCSVLASILAAAFSAQAQPSTEQSLNGAWAFQLVASGQSGIEDRFYRPDFDPAAWAAITVPSNWEIAGFEDPRFREASDAAGLYRKVFTLPDAWRNTHILLHFDGVLYGFEAWINGNAVGSHENPLTPCRFDITPFVRFGNENLLAVRVYKRLPAGDFDLPDTWTLSGICRDVTLQPLSNEHLENVWTSTSVGPPTYLTVHATAAAFDGILPDNNLVLAGNLAEPKGGMVHRFRVPVSGSEPDIAYHIPIEFPQYWTAETPGLYRLTIRLENNGKILHTIQQSAGLREVAVAQGMLMLNGVPIKLRGVNRLDSHPEVGFALREEHWLEDIRLMKAANINMVRTAHLLPHRRFLELCDQFGLYVVCDIPFAKDENRLRARVEEYVRYARRHPSLILWSVGTGVASIPPLETLVQRVKELDPSRPVAVPQPNEDAANSLSAPAGVDVITLRHPAPAQLEAYARQADRPVLAAEYARSLGKTCEDLGASWELMLEYPRLAGGAIRQWADQALYRKAKPGEYEASRGKTLDANVWLSPERCLDNHGIDGADGIVYANRQPQMDYWLVRNVYSPIYIAGREQTLPAGPQVVSLTLANRYNFTSLDDATRCRWTLFEDNSPLAQGAPVFLLPPQSNTVAAIDVWLPETLAERDYRLEFAFEDLRRLPLYEHTVRLCSADGPVNYAAQLAENAPLWTITESTGDDFYTLRWPDFIFTVNQKTGQAALRSADGKITLLADGPWVRVGRRPTLAEQCPPAQSAAAQESFWDPYVLKTPSGLTVRLETATDAESGPTIHMSGRFPRAGKPDQAINAEITWIMSPHGWIDVAYELTPMNAGGVFLEAGLSLLLPPEMSQVSWLGDGPFPSYPGAEEQAQRGLYALPTTDLWFPGNRACVELVAVTDDIGNGLGLVCDAANIAWENSDGGLLLSHNALVSPRAARTASTNAPFRAAETGPLRGGFRITPLTADRWPSLFEYVLRSAKPSRKTAGPPFLADYD